MFEDHRMPEVLVEMFARDDVVIENEYRATVGHVVVQKLEWGWDCQLHPGSHFLQSTCDHVMAVAAELEKARIELEGAGE